LDLVSVLIAGLFVGGIYALVATGLNLLFGVIKVINFAHGESVMIGMYLSFIAFSMFDIDPYLSILVVAPIGFVFGLVIQRLVIQPLIDDALMQIFASFGLVIMFQNIALALTRGQARTARSALSGSTIDLGVVVSLPRAILLFAATAAAFLTMVFLNRTTAGTAIRAVSMDRDTALLMGINVKRAYLVTFGGATALAFIAGSLLSPIFTVTPTAGFQFLLPAFAVVVLGGLGSVPGAYVGGS
jgi:branched-chain amino acid transport system permease protein